MGYRGRKIFARRGVSVSARKDINCNCDDQNNDGNPDSGYFFHKIQSAFIGSTASRKTGTRRKRATRSSNNEYATGVNNSVNNKHKSCPPITTIPIGALEPEPGPRLNTMGIMPATIAKVVIRMGRRRARFACTSASWRSTPRDRKVLV